jgi:hypothetical protein
LAALAATDLTEEGDSKAVALQGAAGPRNVAESHFAIASDGNRAPKAQARSALSNVLGK